jgi:hypothetical protein
VFQGIVNANSVTFNGVPILAPGATGSRILRVTNVRLNANSLYAGPFAGAAPAQAAISFNGALSASLGANAHVGYVTKLPLPRQRGSFPPAAQQPNLTPAATLSFTDIVNTGFMTV